MNSHSPYKYSQYFDADPGVLAVLCRHGSTESNDAKVPLVRAWADVGLDEKGKIEAQLLGHKIRKYQPKELVHSDFARDSETGVIIANILGVSIETDFDLRTWDVGTLAGQPLADANPTIEYLYKNPWIKPPGSGESYNDFSARCLNCLQKHLAFASIEAFRPIVIVTHGKNIACAGTWITGGLAWEQDMPKPGGFAVVGVNKDRTLVFDIDGPFENVIEDI